MTDSSPRDLDQLASDLVDGLLPPAEAERARRDPEVAARATRIEQVRSALRTVPPASPGHAARAISAALAAAAAAQPVRSRRRPLAERARPWLVAAAVVVFGGLATVGLLSLDSSDSDDQDTAATVSSDEAGEHETEDGADDEALDSAGNGGGEPADAPPVASDLGEAASPAELAALVQARSESFAPQVDDGDRLAEGPEGAGQPSTSAAPNSAGDEACAGLSDTGDPARGTSIFTADATFRGTPVRVHLYDRDHQIQLVATDHACTDVVDAPYIP